MNAGAMEDLWAVLPGILPREGPAEREPQDYGAGYQLPVHSTKPLQELNTHSNDEFLTFFEKPHVYTFHGVPTSTSVTTLAHEFERPFVARDAIAGMKTSRSQAWPRLEYVHASWPMDADTWKEGRGALLVCGGKTLSVVPPYSMGPDCTADAVKTALRSTAVSKDNTEMSDAEYHVFDRARTDAEIEAGWGEKGTLASHMGTDRHNLAECFYNGLPHRWWEPDMQVLYTFCREHMIPKGIVAYNTEKEIVCRDVDVAGSLDLIAWDARRGLYHIIDFKRSDKLQAQLRGFGKMAEPFKHLDDCKGAGYALQTSIYQYILERDYGMRIGDRILLSLHAERPFVTSVPYMRAEVEYIMARRMALVAARKAVADEHPEYRCAVTQAPTVDAVRLADGRLVMEKMAQVHELPYTVDRAARRLFEEEVARRVEYVAFDSKGCTPWRRQVPENGIAPFL
jgi:hypothetical protein